MTSIAPRPNYKPGDDEFDFDATNIVYVWSAMKRNLTDISEVKKSLCRQSVYWQGEASRLQAQYEKALETIASMAQTIDKLTSVATDTDADYKHFNSGKSRPGVVRNAKR